MPNLSASNLVRNKLVSAYQQLVSNDADLLKADVNERSITHKLAEYLQNEFPEYDVDCEYNRNGLDPKRLIAFKRDIKSDDADGTTVFPDIIIHHRGTIDNFVVIEAKKSNNGIGRDIEKLKAYKNELGYRFAYLVRFPVGKKLDAFDGILADQLIEEIGRSQ